MEAASAVTDQRSAAELEHDAQARADGDHEREMAEAAANGAELDRAEERDALNYLLGGRRAVVHDIEVEWESEVGLMPITFVVRAFDSRRIDEIEERHRNRTTGMIDTISANVEIVAEATEYLRDKSGRQVSLNSPDFLTAPRPGDSEGPIEHVSKANALEDRFRDQLGLVVGVASEIRRVHGWTGDRIGKAQRRMVRASLD